ncbi:MAG: hypothetical protein MK299_12945, partial [Pseudomonadales bacterium]|nr:hypothetical protein [Pseudomonadales bacterium]
MKLLVDVTRPGRALLLSLGLAACGGESSTSGSTTQSAAPAPQPCGPAGQLADEFSANVGSDARC